MVVDILMLVRLKRTLEEKLKWYDEETNWQKYKAKKKENKNAVKKLIKMVVLNATFGFLFRLPSSFLSILNLYATFYYRNFYNQFSSPVFGEFYPYLLDSGFYSLLIDIYEFLFIVSISIQFFIYKRFGKKFLEGYNLFFLTKKSKNSTNNNNNNIDKANNNF